MGELFPHLDGAMRRFEEDVLREVAAQASSEVHQILNDRIVHPTPYYETQVRTDRSGEGMVVHDSGVIYGPWLEGTSERNQTTSFKGYAAFRTAAQRVNGKVQQLVDAALKRALGNMR